MPNDNTDDTVIMSMRVLGKLVALNRDARRAIEPAGGNSVQEGYRNSCIEKLDAQNQLLEVFVSD